MTRPIKFRAWDTLNKEVTYFTLFERPTATYGTHTEVMQFTGLLDKNGKEIYEGDVIEYGGARNEVKYITELAIYDDIFGLRFASLAGQSEVVGNIYENPELLK